MLPHLFVRFPLRWDDHQYTRLSLVTRVRRGAASGKNRLQTLELFLRNRRMSRPSSEGMGLALLMTRDDGADFSSRNFGSEGGALDCLFVL